MKILDTLLHIFVLGAGLAVLPLISPWFLVLTAFVWATLREQAQHRMILTRAEDLMPVVYRVRKRTFFDFGWLGWKQVREILETTGGAALLVGAFEVFG